MIRTFRVESFKSLVDLEIELGRVNLFIGANGSGKSNLLEAIGILSAAAFGRVDDETLLRRGVRPGVPKLYKSAFPSEKRVPRLLFSAVAGEGALYEVGLWNPLESPAPAWRFMTERLEGADGKKILTRSVKAYGKHNQEQGMAALEIVNLKPGDAVRNLMDDLRSYGIFCPNTPSLRGLVPDQQPREPIGLAGGRLPEAIEEFMQSSNRDSAISDAVEEIMEMLDWAKDFGAEASVKIPLSPSAARSRMVVVFRDRFMARKRDLLSGYDASEGALYILFCAVLALHPKSPSLLAIDTIDQAINPRLACKLMTAVCSWTSRFRHGRQWLLTGHNPAILDGLPLDDDEVRLFAVDRNSKGHTVVKRIDLALALKARPNADWTLSRMWMNGLLGGVPNV